MNEATPDMIERMRKSLKDYPDATLCIDSEPGCQTCIIDGQPEDRKYKIWLDLNDVEIDKEE